MIDPMVISGGSASIVTAATTPSSSAPSRSSAKITTAEISTPTGASSSASGPVTGEVRDTVTLSPQARESQDGRKGQVGGQAAGQAGVQAQGGQAAAGSESSQEQAEMARKVALMKANEQKVIAHEAAHKAAGGTYAGGTSYSKSVGPDGKMYITGGEVSIDVSEGRTPEETIRKAQTVRAAALAPSDPSGQDYAVAAQASRMEQEARAELQTERGKELAGQGKSSSAGAGVRVARTSSAYGAGGVIVGGVGKTMSTERPPSYFLSQYA